MGIRNIENWTWSAAVCGSRPFKQKCSWELACSRQMSGSAPISRHWMDYSAKQWVKVFPKEKHELVPPWLPSVRHADRSLVLSNPYQCSFPKAATVGILQGDCSRSGDNSLKWKRNPFESRSRGYWHDSRYDWTVSTEADATYATILTAPFTWCPIIMYYVKHKNMSGSTQWGDSVRTRFSTTN